ncbi:MAG: hypothetical protein JW951_01400 [Lentisphaerae bacterium]|nr:hypothetical protein [Lentisphaerota bacterium]
MPRLKLILPALLILGGTAGAAGTELLASVRAQPRARAVLTNDYIFVRASGTMDTPYALAARLASLSNALAVVQDAYTASLPAGAEPEFVIRNIEPGRYTYVNRKDERSDILELHRPPPGGDGFDRVFFAAGNRFFGRFRALIAIRVAPAPGGGLAYRAGVYAYPLCAAPRFVVRHLRLADLYFNAKTREIEAVARRVAVYLGETQGKIDFAGLNPHTALHHADPRELDCCP